MTLQMAFSLQDISEHSPLVVTYIVHRTLGAYKKGVYEAVKINWYPFIKTCVPLRYLFPKRSVSPVYCTPDSDWQQIVL